MASAATPAAAAAGGAAYQPSRPPLVVPAARQHRSTLVMLHGLGDSGAGWAFLSRALAAAHLPHTEFVFPSAPLVSPQWAMHAALLLFLTCFYSAASALWLPGTVALEPPPYFT